MESNIRYVNTGRQTLRLWFKTMRMIHAGFDKKNQHWAPQGLCGLISAALGSWYIQMMTTISVDIQHYTHCILCTVLYCSWHCLTHSLCTVLSCYCIKYIKFPTNILYCPVHYMQYDRIVWCHDSWHITNAMTHHDSWLMNHTSWILLLVVVLMPSARSIQIVSYCTKELVYF